MSVSSCFWRGIQWTVVDFDPDLSLFPLLDRRMQDHAAPAVSCRLARSPWSHLLSHSISGIEFVAPRLQNGSQAKCKQVHRMPLGVCDDRPYNSKAVNVGRYGDNRSVHVAQKVSSTSTRAAVLDRGRCRLRLHCYEDGDPDCCKDQQKTNSMRYRQATLWKMVHKR